MRGLQRTLSMPKQWVGDGAGKFSGDLSEKPWLWVRNGSGNIKRLWRAGPVVLYGTGGCPPALDAGHSGQPLTSPSESKLRMIYQD